MANVKGPAPTIRVCSYPPCRVPIEGVNTRKHYCTDSHRVLAAQARKAGKELVPAEVQQAATAVYVQEQVIRKDLATRFDELLTRGQRLADKAEDAASHPGCDECGAPAGNYAAANGAFANLIGLARAELSAWEIMMQQRDAAATAGAVDAAAIVDELVRILATAGLTPEQRAAIAAGIAASPVLL